MRSGHLVDDDYEIVLPGQEGVAEGGRGVVVVRPEWLQVTPGHHAVRDGLNELPGRVHQPIYMGGIRRLEVDLDCGIRVVVQESAGHCSDGGAGDRVNVSWAPERSVLLPDDGTDGSLNRTLA